MSQILDEVNASGGNIAYIRALEVRCAAFPETQFVCTGFRDQLLTLETGQVQLHRAINLGIALPAKDNKGNQTLNFATDNTTGAVSDLVDLATESQQPVTVVYRTYLSNNKLAPSEKPYRMSLLGGELQGVIANLQCGYFNILTTAYPRRYLTADYAPGLRYIP